ncbi:MAG: 3-deoxy-D-manno-octulosonic acid transferase, partial [Burkholderiaceae bacterium]
MYGLHMAERFGRYETPPTMVQVAATGYVWIHAVSLGETRAAAILLVQLRSQLPGMRLLLTHSTATGREEGAKLLQSGDMQAWLPWDTQGATQRFFNHFKPRIGIVMETEVWPNLCAQAQRHGVPLVLANARLNDSSARSAQRMAWLARPAYASFAQVWAQTQEDAQRLHAVGATQVSVQGNVKYDATPEATQVQQGRTWRANSPRPVLMLASAREGEDALFLEQIRAIVLVARTQSATNLVANNEQNFSPSQAHAAATGAVQWLIVPRHPQRFDEVAQAIERAGFTVSRRSQWGAQPVAADVWLGDSLGEMALYYGLAHVALLGGSFAPLGGQNLIEAIAAGCPVVMGPHTFNFAEAAQTAEKQGAAVREADMPRALQAALSIVADKAWNTAMCSAGTQWLTSSRGATQRMASALAGLLNPPG